VAVVGTLKIYERLLAFLDEVASGEKGENGIPLYTADDVMRFRQILIDILKSLKVRDHDYPFGPVFEDMLQLQTFGVPLPATGLVRYLEVRRDCYHEGRGQRRGRIVGATPQVGTGPRRKIKSVEGDETQELWVRGFK